MEMVRGLFFDAGGTVFDWKNTARVQWDGILSCEFLGYYKPSLQAYKKGVRLLELQPAEAMMVAAHEGDLTAAQAAGLHTAYIKFPEKDVIDDVFEQPDKTGFDVEASDFEDLCKKLKV